MKGFLQDLRQSSHDSAVVLTLVATFGPVEFGGPTVPLPLPEPLLVKLE